MTAFRHRTSSGAIQKHCYICKYIHDLLLYRKLTPPRNAKKIFKMFEGVGFIKESKACNDSVYSDARKQANFSRDDGICRECTFCFMGS